MALTAREQNAFHKAIAGNLAATVRRLEHGVYLVPSTSADAIDYIVCGVALDGSDHTCTCPAGEQGYPCKHVAAVRLARVQHEALRQVRQLRRAAASTPAPARQSTVHLTVNGQTFSGTGRSRLEALANAQPVQIAA